MKVSKQSKVMLLAAGLALLAPSAMKAQQPADARAAERAAAFAKSQQIQSDLAAISGNRAGAEAALISQWQSVLDPNVYDLEREIGPLAARAIDWQLYGASKVGDFSLMIDVLRGRIGAGNFLGERGPGDPNVFGNTLEELVYTPIAPCRVVDTRGVGARTGVLGAGVARTFDLTTDGFGEGQGGSAACPGLPSFSHFGWAVNVTVTGNAGNGWLTIWPFSGTEPVASQVNYASRYLVGRERLESHWLQWLCRRRHYPRESRRNTRDHRRAGLLPASDGLHVSIHRVRRPGYQRWFQQRQLRVRRNLPCGNNSDFGRRRL